MRGRSKFYVPVWLSDSLCIISTTALILLQTCVFHKSALLTLLPHAAPIRGPFPCCCEQLWFSSSGQHSWQTDALLPYSKWPDEFSSFLHLFHKSAFAFLHANISSNLNKSLCSRLLIIKLETPSVPVVFPSLLLFLEASSRKLQMKTEENLQLQRVWRNFGFLSALVCLHFSIPEGGWIWWGGASPTLRPAVILLYFHLHHRALRHGSS